MSPTTSPRRACPFREAHEVVGRLVLVCEERGCRLDDLPLAVFQEASPLFGPDIVSSLDIDAIVGARSTMGGTSPSAVREQMRLVRATLVADEAHLEGISSLGPHGGGRLIGRLDDGGFVGERVHVRVRKRFSWALCRNVGFRPCALGTMA